MVLGPRRAEGDRIAERVGYFAPPVVKWDGCLLEGAMHQRSPVIARNRQEQGADLVNREDRHQ